MHRYHANGEQAASVTDAQLSSADDGIATQFRRRTEYATVTSYNPYSASISDKMVIRLKLLP